jgi:hypothetical protein
MTRSGTKPMCPRRRPTRIRRAWLAAACLALVMTAAHAQNRPAPAVNCTDVQVGSAQSYDCINAQLGNVANAQPRPSSATDAPISASSPGYETGTFNQAATANRLGQNFGKSVVPYRPTQNIPPPLPPR